MYWELHQSVEGIILLKSICTAIHDDFGVPNTYIQRYLNLIFPPLKCSSLKHLWYLTILGEIDNKSVRNMITENIVKQKLGQKYYLLGYEYAYILATTEIEVAHDFPRGTNTIPNEI